MQNLISLIGLFAFLLIAFAFSKSRKHINTRMVVTGVLLQLMLALLVLGIPALGFSGPLRFAFDLANDGVIALLGFTSAGSKFIFGDLMDTSKYGFVIAFHVLPIIIFMSALMAVLYHVGLMQLLVDVFARLMHKTMGISGAESLSASANIFFGQTEAPLVVRPFINKMTESELFCVMVGGMATVAGSVLGAYTGLLSDKIPNIAGHLLTASVMSAPAALVVAKIMLPETGTPETLTAVPEEFQKNKPDTNVIEALARGAGEGLTLALNVAAMLIAFIAVITMLDTLLIAFGNWVQFAQWGSAMVPSHLLADGKTAELSFSLIAGWIFAPLALLMGIPWQDGLVAGILLGQKIVLNEFVAYMSLATMLDTLSERTVIILSYALCGFANFSSIGIQIGGIGGMAPTRRKDLARLGVRSIIGGSLAAFMTAAIAGLLI